MHWQRLGQVFDPAEHKLLDGQCGYAQSPQTLVFDDFVRVYFSTRTRDRSGEFVSHVVFVDFDRGFQRVVGHSVRPVIELGKLGSFDEHGIFPMNVLRDGSVVRAFTTGWSRRKSVPVDAAIGLAFSDDGGVTFQKHGEGPILGPSLHQPFLVGDAFVARYDNCYHMWYIHGVKWMRSLACDAPERVYKISHAASSDCVTWTACASQLIEDRLGEDECQALPTVIQLGNRYHMWFCYRFATDFRKNPGRAYKLGHASSDDLIHWNRDDTIGQLEGPLEAWDSEMQCYPHVFHSDSDVYMLYNGNEFGRNGFGLAKLVR